MSNILNSNSNPQDILYITFKGCRRIQLPLCEVLDGSFSFMDSTHVILHNEVTNQHLRYTRQIFAASIKQKLERDEDIISLSLKIGKQDLIKII